MILLMLHKRLVVVVLMQQLKKEKCVSDSLGEYGRDERIIWILNRIY